MKLTSRAIPSSRFSRLAKFGGLATKVAGNILFEGVKQVGSGKSPEFKQLLLSRDNVEALADRLAHLRGAAMKIGQLLSMDAGELLPPELTVLLAKLRSHANPMPHKQLLAELNTQLGDDWIDNFSRFDFSPFAAASIGQVHRAYGFDGEDYAVKVQYPGIAQAIESDVDNVATLLKLTKLIPEQIQLDALLEEAKKQLLVEADYSQEREYLQRYRQCMTPYNDFIVPNSNEQCSNSNVLIMEYIEGDPIESMIDLSQSERDRIITLLLQLFMQELFDIKLMQSDPNFANYLYQRESGKVVLLDFGATRDIPDQVSQGYLALFCAALVEDRQGIFNALLDIGFFQRDIDANQREQLITIVLVATEPLRFQGEYDFAASDIAGRIKQLGLALSAEQDRWHTPPIDALFIHRKLAGLYLLAAKLNAKANTNALFQPYYDQNDPAAKASLKLANS